MNIEVILSSKFLFYIEVVIQYIHPGHICTKIKIALNGYSNVVQCLLSLFKTDVIFDSLVFIKPFRFGQINLSKVDSNILVATFARILQAMLIINVSL